MAGVPLRMERCSRELTFGNSDFSFPARSASACNAQVFTMELRSSKYVRSPEAARRHSLRVSGSRGTICARCQRNSCSLASCKRRKSSALKGRNNSGRASDAFSAASAERILIRVSSARNPQINSANNAGRVSTSAATSSACPIERRSPPVNFSRIPFGAATGSLRSTSRE